MTPSEVTTLLSFLAGGFLAGIIGHWLDLLVSTLRKR